MKDILRVKNLNKSYKNFSLTDVSFSLFLFNYICRIILMLNKKY